MPASLIMSHLAQAKCRGARQAGKKVKGNSHTAEQRNMASAVQLYCLRFHCWEELR